ncbi:hypothetical protein M569_12925, partial [Genlisea aurea]
YGSFFGPSQPVIAQRVIQESKTLLENPELAERIFKPKNTNNKSSASAPVKSKPQGNYPASHPIRLKQKAEMLKQARDYSFLQSDDAVSSNPKTETYMVVFLLGSKMEDLLEYRITANPVFMTKEEALWILETDIN